MSSKGKLFLVVNLIMVFVVFFSMTSVAWAEAGGNGKGKGRGAEASSGSSGSAPAVPPGQVNKGSEGSSGSGEVRHEDHGKGPVTDEDPCIVLGNCGPGDHGRGDPDNGSEHANCRAAQGEVDPDCDEETTDDPPPPPSDDPPPPDDGDDEEDDGDVVDDGWTRRVCFISQGNAVEFFSEEHDYDERHVIGESWDVHCEDLAGGRYVIRPWNAIWGHGPRAPKYLVIVEEPGDTVFIYNPYRVGEVVDFGGVVVERLTDQAPTNLRAR